MGGLFGGGGASTQNVWSPQQEQMFSALMPMLLKTSSFATGKPYLQSQNPLGYISPQQQTQQAPTDSGDGGPGWGVADPGPMEIDWDVTYGTPAGTGGDIGDSGPGYGGGAEGEGQGAGYRSANQQPNMVDVLKLIRMMNR